MLSSELLFKNLILYGVENNGMFSWTSHGCKYIITFPFVFWDSKYSFFLVLFLIKHYNKILPYSGHIVYLIWQTGANSEPSAKTISGKVSKGPLWNQFSSGGEGSRLLSKNQLQVQKRRCDSCDCLLWLRTSLNYIGWILLSWHHL